MGWIWILLHALCTMSAARGKGGKAAKAQAVAIKWLQCDLCEKWRRIPAFVDISAFEGQE